MRLAHFWLSSLLLLASAAARSAPATETAIFAGGCFWSMQGAFDVLRGQGVLSTTAGYSGGAKVNPTYREVSAGDTGHLESVRVEFDPAKLSYDKLLDTFWHNIDPYDGDGQFCDDGPEYHSAIFVGGDAQKKTAEASKDALTKRGPKKKPVTTAILPAGKFYPAEDYHQEYAQKNPVAYRAYRVGCGRDPKLREIWGALAPAFH